MMRGGKAALALTISLIPLVGGPDRDAGRGAATALASREAAKAAELGIERDEVDPMVSTTTTTRSSTAVPISTSTSVSTGTNATRGTNGTRGTTGSSPVNGTAPPPVPPSPTTPPPPTGGLHVAAVGDIQPPGNSSNSTATAAVAARADFILGLGDYQYQDGSMADYNRYFDQSWGANVPKMYPVLAPNHDGYWQDNDTLRYWNGAGARGMRAPVTLRPLTPYSFNRGGWHFVALPDACYRVSGCDPGVITAWLNADLIANPTACTVAYFHQAYFTSASDHDPYQEVQPWVKVLVDHRVDLLLQGHNHNYERFALQNESRGADPAGIQAFVVGTGGIGFYPFRGTAPNSVTRQADTYGVLNLTLGRGSYSWDFARAAGGSYTDHGSMSCR